MSSPSGTTTFSYNNRHLATGMAHTNMTGFALPSNVTFNYDAAGHRTLMTDSLGSVKYNYNDLGQLESEERHISEVSATPFILSYMYNVSGELTKITNEKWNVNVVGSVDYRAFGGVKTVNYGNTRSLDVTYDARLRVRQWDVQDVLGWIYSYQYFGEKTGRVTFADNLYDTTLDRSYEYDHVGRLIRSETGSDARYHINPAASSGTGDGAYSQTYTYDQWGNMSANQGRGGTDYAPYTGLLFNIRNQRQGYTYDTAGNLKVAGTWTYLYDATGQQVEAKEGGVLKLKQWYDGNGLRVKKQEIGSTTETTYYLRSSALGGQVVAEFDASSQMKRGYVYMGGQMLALQDKDDSNNQQIVWVHQDSVTKSQRFTNSAGALIPSKVDLDPWGIETRDSFSPEKQPHRYTTYERDANKSDEAMNRRYTATRNRFDQPDPLDGSYNMANPQSLNRYSYVHNDPVNFTDPSGLQETSDWCPPMFGACDGGSGGGAGYAGHPADSNNYYYGGGGPTSEFIAGGLAAYEQRLQNTRDAMAANAAYQRGDYETAERMMDANPTLEFEISRSEFAHAGGERMVSMVFDISKGKLYIYDSALPRKFWMKATSGKGNCLNNSSSACLSAYRQGPIPTGDYFIDMKNFTKLSAIGSLGRLFTGRGDWGLWRVDITPYPWTSFPSGRTGGFMLHDGIFRGSAGCIDVGGPIPRDSALRGSMFGDSDGIIPLDVYP